jgi:cation diffusion facilitator CzcD-associated flavoprotein CzcO
MLDTEFRKACLIIHTLFSKPDMSSVAHGRCSNILASDLTPTFTPSDLHLTPGLKVSGTRMCREAHRSCYATDRAFAGAPSILNYLRTVAARHGIDKHINFHHQVLGLDWRPDEQKWRVEVLVSNSEKTTFWARFVIMGTGYYDYNEVRRRVGQSCFSRNRLFSREWPYQ